MRVELHETKTTPLVIHANGKSKRSGDLYKKIETTFLERLEMEHSELNKKIIKLTAFLVKEESGETNILKDEDYNDMVEQSEIMCDYRSILAKRMLKHRNTH